MFSGLVCKRGEGFGVDVKALALQYFIVTATNYYNQSGRNHRDSSCLDYYGQRQHSQCKP